VRARYVSVKTARFETIVQRCGKPEAHLVLTAPAKDRTLQSAVKEKRVMTVFQESVGTKADRGEVGFHPGPGRQFLLFPKSLRAFAGKAVVGIKYELLESPTKSETRKTAKSPATKNKKPARSKRRQEPRPERAANVVEFKVPEEDNDDDDQVAELKKQVRRAMAALEKGKQVAAFNLLKRIVGD
jgi:hypothetical protein